MEHTLDRADFRSDTVTTPTPAMRRAMADAVVGDDVLREDPTLQRLEELAAGLLGKEAALFVPTGTMANQIGVKLFTKPGDEILAEENCHILNYEAGAIGMISGVVARPIPTERGIFTAQDVERRIRGVDVHASRTALICVENTHNLAGGVPWTLTELDAVRAVASARGIPLLMDGARLFNACAAEGVAAAAYAARADLAWFALSKGLSAPVGSVLCGTRAAIEECRRIRKQLGGGMRQAGVLAACGLVALETMRERLVEDHARARRLAEGIAPLPGVMLDPASVRTNIVMIPLRETIAARVAERLAREFGVLVVAMGAARIRLVTHREVDDSHVARAIAAFEAVFAA